ncbi:MAG: Hsp20/alpha crystallin family protein [Burkholderiaceae bacterium]
MLFAPSLLGRSTRFGCAPTAHLNAGSFDSLFDSAARPAAPEVRVEKGESSVTLSIDVPGLAKDQLTIAIEGDIVRIDSKADAPRSFKAAYQLADEIDAATSEAKLENGVLTLKLGKVVPASRETVLTIS